jgi:hypothetical protein
MEARALTIDALTQAYVQTLMSAALLAELRMIHHYVADSINPL